MGQAPLASGRAFGGQGAAKRHTGLQAPEKSPAQMSAARGFVAVSGRQRCLALFHIGLTTGAGGDGLADKTRKDNHRQDIGQGIHGLHRNGQ